MKPERERCPTCGSDERKKVGALCHQATINFYDSSFMPGWDKWHDSPEPREEVMPTDSRDSVRVHNLQTRDSATSPVAGVSGGGGEVYQGQIHSGKRTHFVGDGCWREKEVEHG